MDVFRKAQLKAKPKPFSGASRNRHMELSKWVVHESVTGKLKAIGSNFFAAAMQIAFLLSRRYPANQLPELCSNLQDFTRVLIRSVILMNPVSAMVTRS